MIYFFIYQFFFEESKLYIDLIQLVRLHSSYYFSILLLLPLGGFFLKLENIKPDLM